MTLCCKKETQKVLLCARTFFLFLSSLWYRKEKLPCFFSSRKGFYGRSFLFNYNMTNWMNYQVLVQDKKSSPNLFIQDFNLCLSVLGYPLWVFPRRKNRHVSNPCPSFLRVTGRVDKKDIFILICLTLKHPNLGWERKRGEERNEFVYK